MSDIKEVLVPDLGEDSVEVIEICVSVGDSLDAEDSIVTVESDKASMDIPAPFAGDIAEICVAVGDKISEGSLLAKMKTASAAEAAPAVEETVSSAPAAPAAAGLKPRQHQQLQHQLLLKSLCQILGVMKMSM